MTKKKLETLLNKYRIDTSLWKKSVDRLLSEINEGSTGLVESEGALKRTVQVAVLFCTADGLHFMAEVREHSHKKEFVLTEKYNAGESGLSACKRGLYEELGLVEERDYRAQDIRAGDSLCETKSSHSYPGIDTDYLYQAFFIKVKRLPDPAVLKEHNDLSLQIIEAAGFTFPNSYFI